MARKEIDITITDEGRDKGKVYHLTEMPASQAEEWAAKALLALAHSDVDIGETTDGMAGIARLGLKALAKMKFEDLKPLMDEMFTCVMAIPDPNVPTRMRKLVENDIEEVATRLRLRAELFTLHTGFSMAGNQLTSTSEGAPATSHSSRTKTSPRR